MTINLVGKKCKCCGNNLSGNSLYTGANGGIDYHCGCGCIIVVKKGRKSECIDESYHRQM